MGYLFLRIFGLSFRPNYCSYAYQLINNYHYYRLWFSIAQQEQSSSLWVGRLRFTREMELLQRVACQPPKNYSTSLLYSAFIIQLQHPSQLAILYLALYCALFLIFTLKTYSIFHYPPSQPNYHSLRFDATLIFKYKLVQERRAQLEDRLRSNKSTELLEQYLALLKSGSFCDTCEKAQPPRAYHCFVCDSCILKKHFHSKAIGFCIGQNNETPYMLYLLSSKFMSLYGFVSLIVNQLDNNSNFDKLSEASQILFFALVFAFFACFVYYFKSSLQFLWHLQNNVSFTQSQNPHLQKNISLYGKDKAKLSYGGCLGLLLSCKQMGDVSYWSSQAEQLSDQT